MKIGSLFSGYGGLDIAVESFFHAETVWHAEWEDAPSKVLAHHWPGVPNFRDVTQVDWAAVEPVDIITGGFPCQDVSMAGKRAGMVEGTRSNLWGAMRAAVETIRPRYVVAENVRGLLSATAQSDSDMEQRPGFMGDGAGYNLRAIGRVLGDLADIGYDAQWYGLRAADIGAPHNRFRVFILATNAEHDGQSASPVGGSDGTTTTTRGRAGRIEEDHDGQPAGGHLADSGPGHLQRPEDLTDTDDDRCCSERHSESDENPGCTRSAVDRGTTEHAERIVAVNGVCEEVSWGIYESAIRRWERIHGNAPSPTHLSSAGKHVLNPAFTEWMMGLEQGWVTDVPGVSRANQIKMCGNGVVPQQAYEALRRMKEAA